MKPQSLQDAIKAAAAAKRNKVEKGGWKEPEVKVHKMSAEEYETLRGKRPSVPTPPVTPISSTTNNSSNHNGSNHSMGSDAAMRQQLERDRQEFAREKQEILNEMRACRRDAQGANEACASLQRSVDRLQTKVERLQDENQSLREQVRNQVVGSSSNHSNSRNNFHSSASKIAADEYDWDRLEGRVERMESEHRKLKERIVSGGGDSGGGNSDPDVERLKLKVDRLEAETRALRDKLARVDRLEDETRALREKLSSLSSSSSSSTLTSPRTTVTTVPVPPKSPSLTKNTYAPTSPVTPSKPSATTTVKATTTTAAAASPSKSPKRTKSSNSIKAAMGDSSSTLNAGGGTPSPPIYTLFSADKIGKYQARDDALKAYLSNPNAPIGMYPRKVMSVESVQGRSLVHFRNKVYVPASLRERAMEWHYETYQHHAKERLADHCTWPHQERDMFDYVRNHS